MIIDEIKLNIEYEKLGLEVQKQPEFTGYILKNYDEYCGDRKRPCVIICPGGAYFLTSTRETTPVAMSYVASGICAFVLRYSVAPARFPTSLVEVATCVKYVRDHAEEYNIDPEKICVLGFSAGGHLAASLGVFWNHEVLASRGFVGDGHKPNAVLLSYPVITSGEKRHERSFHELLGEKHDEMLEFVSLEKRITKDCPPVFLWHTFTDPGVPVENSLLFASGAVANGIKTELHVYPKGKHGLSLGNNLVNSEIDVHKNIDSWQKFSVDFIYDL